MPSAEPDDDALLKCITNRARITPTRSFTTHKEDAVATSRGELLDQALSGGFSPEMYDQLAALRSPQLHTILMHLMEQKVGSVSPAELVAQYQSDRFVQTAVIPQRWLIGFDEIAVSLLPETYEAVELSPVAPLGANAVLASVSQKKVLGTIRRTEVMADSVTSLALEAAKRRNSNRGQPDKDVCLGTSHREIRVQAFDPASGFTPHFRSFSLVAEGPCSDLTMFARQHFLEQIGFYLSLLRQLNATGQYHTARVRVALSNLVIMEYLMKSHGVDREVVMRNTTDGNFDPFAQYGISLPQYVSDVADIPDTNIDRYLVRRPVRMLGQLQTSVIPRLAADFPEVDFGIDVARTAGVGYYPSVCFKISAINSEGAEFPLADGGLTSWGKKLLQRPDERVLASGMGSELFCRFFRARNSCRHGSP